MLMVKAEDLAEAIAPARPHPRKKRPKPLPVSLEFQAVEEMLTVIEAKHGAFAIPVPASGDWPAAVQVDGVMLSKLSRTWSRGTVLELTADSESLIIHMGKSIVRVARTDGGGVKAIKRSPVPTEN